MMTQTIDPTPDRRPLLQPTLDTLDEARWQAVVARDAAADGRFVTAVKTTGIYCRPSCPARRPKRENVEFFLTCGEAEAAGFRACLRCRPAGAPPADERLAKIQRACRLIEQAEEPPKLAELAAAVGLSPFHLQRKFREAVGVSPRVYFESLRRKRLQQSLEAGRSVTDALYEAGFGSSSRLYDASYDLLGMTPSRYRARAPGEVVQWTVAASPLGRLLVAATDKGVCRIELGDDREALARRMEQLFSEAHLVEGGPELARWVEEILAFLAQPAKGLTLPLDIRGTAFEQRVWEALRQIPVGETASYGAVARALGEPRSARAVARACGANPVALAVPCHRVIASDGSLGGYRWGVERKRKLLEREGAAGAPAINPA